MGVMKDLWIKWKMLKLPWRKTFLIGQDLSGNTFWEFQDKLNVGRLRRIVRYNPRAEYADVKVSPQWHQWLRQTRIDPPSVQEQQTDLVRQSRLKYLAQVADERWANKPSLLDKPKGRPPPTPEGQVEYTSPSKPGTTEHMKDAADIESNVKSEAEKDNPWERAAGHKGWEPQAWSPGAARR